MCTQRGARVKRHAQAEPRPPAMEHARCLDGKCAWQGIGVEDFKRRGFGSHGAHTGSGELSFEVWV